jgi:hypothetical protein
MPTNQIDISVRKAIQNFISIPCVQYIVTIDAALDLTDVAWITRAS